MLDTVDPELAAFFLDRLRHVIAVQKREARNCNEEGQRLFQHAIFSLYRDAVDVGAGNEARKIIAGVENDS
jgi:hypothetical protein